MGKTNYIDPITEWVNIGAAVITQNGGGSATITSLASSTTGAKDNDISAFSGQNLSGKTYYFTFDAITTGASINKFVQATLRNNTDPSQRKELFFKPQGTISSFTCGPFVATPTTVGLEIDIVGFPGHATEVTISNLGLTQNLLASPKTFDAAAWGVTGAAVATPGASDPAGGTTAYAVTMPAGGAGLSQSMAVAAGSVVIGELEIAPDTSDIVTLRMLFTGGATADRIVKFNPITGLVTNNYSDVEVTATATTNGYYLLSMTAASGSNTNVVYSISGALFGGTQAGNVSDIAQAFVSLADDDIGSVSIAGTGQEGETLTANVLDELSASATLETTQWYRDGASIPGADSLTYDLVQPDVGADITNESYYLKNGIVYGPVVSNSIGPILIATNQAPVLDAIGAQSTAENQPLQFTVTATDPDAAGNPILSATPLPTGATFDAGTGLFSWTPSVGQSSGSPYSVTFNAEDPQNATINTSEVVEITVQAVLSASFASIAPFPIASFAALSVNDADFSALAPFPTSSFTARSTNSAELSASIPFPSAAFAAGTANNEASFSASAPFPVAVFAAESVNSVTFSAESPFPTTAFAASFSSNSTDLSAVAPFPTASFSAIHQTGTTQASLSAFAPFPVAEFTSDSSANNASLSAESPFPVASFSALSVNNVVFVAEAPFPVASFTTTLVNNGATLSAVAPFPTASFSTVTGPNESSLAAIAPFPVADFSSSSEQDKNLAILAAIAPFPTANFNAVSDNVAIFGGELSFNGIFGDVIEGDTTVLDTYGLSGTNGQMPYSVSVQGDNGTASIFSATWGASISEKHIRWKYVPTEEVWFGTDTFTLAVTNDSGFVSIQAISILIRGGNQPAQGDLITIKSTLFDANGIASIEWWWTENGDIVPDENQQFLSADNVGSVYQGHAKVTDNLGNERPFSTEETEPVVARIV